MFKGKSCAPKTSVKRQHNCVVTTEKLQIRWKKYEFMGIFVAKLFGKVIRSPVYPQSCLKLWFPTTSFFCQFDSSRHSLGTYVEDSPSFSNESYSHTVGVNKQQDSLTGISFSGSPVPTHHARKRHKVPFQGLLYCYCLRIRICVCSLFFLVQNIEGLGQPFQEEWFYNWSHSVQNANAALKNFHFTRTLPCGLRNVRVVFAPRVQEGKRRQVSIKVSSGLQMRRDVFSNFVDLIITALKHNVVR